MSSERTPRARIALLTLLILLLPAYAFANPIGIGAPPYGFSALMVITSAFVCEVLVTALILAFFGLYSVGFIAVLFAANILFYFTLFLPVFGLTHSVPLVEFVIVGVEGAFIRFVSGYSVFQQDTFAGLKWRYAYLAAVIGNATSYLIGLYAFSKYPKETSVLISSLLHHPITS